MIRAPLETLRNAEYRKSSFSDPKQDCVEISHAPDLLGIRDSKQIDTPVLVVSGEQGRAFIRAVRTAQLVE